MDVTFDDVVLYYFSVRGQMRPVLPERDRYSFKHLHAFFGGRQMSAIRRCDVRAYIACRQAAGVKISTVQRELRLFSAAANLFRVEHGLDGLANPAANLCISKQPGRVRWITREQAGNLVLEAERYAKRPHFPVFLRLALNTGCRRGELLNLEWSRISLDQALLVLEPEQNKSHRRRSVPLNLDALAALKRMRHWQAEHGVNSRYVFGYEGGRRIGCLKTAMRGALQRAGIDNFRIHDLRHTFANWLVMQGESIYVVKDLLGHANVEQTEIYAHLAPTQGKAAVDRLLPF
ncbi:MAG: site-specific integrase [Azoarcus sp.]|nr:site-specific integrase [Azoarcus sp.]